VLGDGGEVSGGGIARLKPASMKQIKERERRRRGNSLYDIIIVDIENVVFAVYRKG